VKSITSRSTFKKRVKCRNNRVRVSKVMIITTITNKWMRRFHLSK